MADTTYHILVFFLNLYTVSVKKIVEVSKSRIFVERVWNYSKLMKWKQLFVDFEREMWMKRGTDGKIRKM